VVVAGFSQGGAVALMMLVGSFFSQPTKYIDLPSFLGASHMRHGQLRAVD
jgi:predicted esterase